jgi:hypothetical protein
MEANARIRNEKSQWDLITEVKAPHSIGGKIPFLECREPELARQSFANQKTCKSDSFSPGEKSGMRTDVKTDFATRANDSVFSL